MNTIQRAFTLIELLIVVAVIAILASIAAVNYQEAQVRAKVSRVKSDIRTLFTAIEAYRTDSQAYPAAALGDLQLEAPLVVLTTPVAYVSSVPRDPFGPCPYDFSSGIVLWGYSYKDRATTSINLPADTYGPVWESQVNQNYFIHSPGPNLVWDVTPFRYYDPTNGSTSAGDICVFGPRNDFDR